MGKMKELWIEEMQAKIDEGRFLSKDSIIFLINFLDKAEKREFYGHLPPTNTSAIEIRTIKDELNKL